MRGLWEHFYYSIADELIPDIPLNKNGNPTKFALILSRGHTLTANDICKISLRCRLSPIFFALSRENELDISRTYARSLDTTVVMPRNYLEFVYATQECKFCISEEMLGGILSFFSHTPAYLNSGCKDCRTLLGELMGSGISPSIFIPYTKNRANIINRVQVLDAEFSMAIKKLRTYMSAKLYGFLDI